MLTTWVYTLLSVIVVSLVSFIGIVIFKVNPDRLKRVLLVLVSFAAGALLGDAFIHLIPEAFNDDPNGVSMPFFILLGIVIFFILEKYLHWRHCHIPTSEQHPHSMAINNIVGDALHNFVDGLIIAGAYLVSVPLGVATTAAVLLHEIPQEIGDYGILLYAGWTKAKALFYNFLSACLAVIGAVLTLVIGSSFVDLQHFLIPFTIGGFIYIAAADLIPELKKETAIGKSTLQLLSLIGGIVVMALLLLID